MTLEDSNNNSNAFDEQIILDQFKSVVETHPKTQEYAPIDGKILLKFLRCRDYDVDLALKVLINYITIINERPDIFTWSEDIKSVNNASLYHHYPKRNIDGSAIILAHPGRWNPKEISVETITTQSLLFVEATLLNEDVQRNGVIALFDLRGVGFTQIYNYGIANAKLASYLTEECMPAKVIKVHVVYENRLADMAYSLFKPFLNEKLQQSIVFHGHDLQRLYKYVPQSVLPLSFGGTGPEYSADYYNQVLEKSKDSVLNIWELFRKKDIR